MPDIIQLLPESIANQIAAGEVIQRPSSVVKELLENSVDAGSTFIQLVIKDAGKTLIQVIDNGSGMSETDARMSLERHATSKITKAEDLFAIKTMGFRGEAMASIASIAQMQIITKTADRDTATLIEVAASKIKKQEYCQAPNGTSISVKNLFYNIPARRKFLKSDSVELKHIIEEFKRVSLANPTIKFSLKHNSNEVYHLQDQNLRKRIVNIFGKKYNEDLVPIDTETDVINISGYIGKPSSAKKVKGDQYLFVNNRYIRSPYLNHAIKLAFSSLINEEHTPFFVLYLEIDPSKIDINVHPTKTEIKFDEERLIYQYLKVSVQHGLGKYNVTPSIDFEAENTLIGQRSPATMIPTQYAPSKPSKAEKDAWSSLYQDIGQENHHPENVVRIQSEALESSLYNDTEQQVEKRAYQLHNTYVINQIKSGYLVIHQQHAHERILYEKLLKIMDNKEKVTQQLLFPITLDLKPEEVVLVEKLLPSIHQLGFNIEHFGDQSFIIHGVPALIQQENAHALIIELIRQASDDFDFNAGIKESVASSFAKQSCIKKNNQLTQEEMTRLIDDLFACEVPYVSPSGKKCFVDIDLQTLENMF